MESPFSLCSARSLYEKRRSTEKNLWRNFVTAVVETRDTIRPYLFRRRFADFEFSRPFGETRCFVRGPEYETTILSVDELLLRARSSFIVRTNNKLHRHASGASFVAADKINRLATRPRVSHWVLRWKWEQKIFIKTRDSIVIDCPYIIDFGRVYVFVTTVPI